MGRGLRFGICTDQNMDWPTTVERWRLYEALGFDSVWDCDHFDLVTDMQHNIGDCRAWFSHQGYTTWGSAQTATGRINCYFNASAAGDYSCVAQLQSYPTTSGATVFRASARHFSHRESPIWATQACVWSSGNRVTPPPAASRPSQDSASRSVSSLGPTT